MTSKQKIAIDLYQERSIAQVLRSALTLSRHYPKLFLVLTVGVIVPYDLLAMAVGHRGLFGHAHHGFGLFTLTNAADVLIIAPFIAAASVNAVVVIGEGRRPRLSTTLACGPQVIAVVVAVQAINYLGIAVAALFLVVPGVLLGLRWCVAAVIAAVECNGVRGALKRSGELAAGHYWHIFGLTVTVEAVALVAALGVRLATGDNSSGAGVAGLELIMQTIVASYIGLTLSILYFDLYARQRHDVTVED